MLDAEAVIEREVRLRASRPECSRRSSWCSIAGRGDVGEPGRRRAQQEAGETVAAHAGIVGGGAAAEREVAATLSERRRDDADPPVVRSHLERVAANQFGDRSVESPRVPVNRREGAGTEGVDVDLAIVVDVQTRELLADDGVEERRREAKRRWIELGDGDAAVINEARLPVPHRDDRTVRNPRIVHDPNMDAPKQGAAAGSWNKLSSHTLNGSSVLLYKINTTQRNLVAELVVELGHEQVRRVLNTRRAVVVGLAVARLRVRPRHQVHRV